MNGFMSLCRFSRLEELPGEAGGKSDGRVADEDGMVSGFVVTYSDFGCWKRLGRIGAATFRISTYEIRE